MPHPTESAFTIRLYSLGNPDFGQFAPISNPVTLTVASIAEAVVAAENYREEWNLGGGNWGAVYVKKGRTKVARIAYNGHVSRPGDRWF